jgi:hypothetical protein
MRLRLLFYVVEPYNSAGTAHPGLCISAVSTRTPAANRTEVL